MNGNPLFSRKDIAKILLPLVLQNILTITIGMVDSIMVSGDGEAAFAGVSLVSSLDTLLVTLFSSIASGGAVVLAQTMGRGDQKLSCEAAKQLLYVTSAIAAVISVCVLIPRTALLQLLFGEVEADVMRNALGYFSIIAISFPFLAVDNAVGAIFRAQGDSMISLKISIFKNLLNISGNAFFIYGLHMGAIGAALATLIARIIGAVVLIAIAHGKVRYIYIEHLFTYRPNKEIIKAILHIGVPNGIENSLFQFGKVITSSLISTLSTASIAANAAALSLANLQYTTGGAVQSTMISVVGKCVGAEEKEQAKHYAKVLLFLGYVLIFIVSVLLAVFASPLLSLYNLSPEGLVTAKELIWFHGAASIVLWAAAFCLPSVFRAANDVRFTMVVSIFSMWAFRVALAQILVPESLTVFGYELAGAGMDIMGVWVAMTIDWVFRAILFAWRFYSDRWLTKYKAL